jgi:anti-sigma regulatory factor (Ser/Thr protein kinase)
VVTHQLDSEAASVPEARRLALEFAGSLMSDQQCSHLEVAISEVVGNAVRHSGSADDVRLMLTRKDGYLCVRVTDGGTGLVPRPGAMASEPGAGFGLFLVEQLTRRWGVTREDGRTRVWFEIDYAEGAHNGDRPSDAPCDPL